MVYLFLFAHLVADFALQPYWLVVRKRRWDGLLIHGGLVLACMLMLALIEPTVLVLWPTMLVITIIHVATDWWKVHRADRLLRPAILPFLLDQAIHGATLVTLLWIALGWQAWVIDVPSASWAIYGCALVTAALAVPIGVMVWLDPSFAHLALAPAARRRSAVLGALGTLLALLAGPLALPLGLGGLVVAAQRTDSAHPLDTMRGKVAVLLLGALVGALVRAA